MILPVRMRQDVDGQGRTSLQELRLRLNKPPELIMGGESLYLDTLVNADDLNFCLNTASRYSPWSAASMANGYLTAAGGHRIGICGHVTVHNGKIYGIDHLSSLCIRIARDFPGLAGELAEIDDSILILGSPGSGKTTLLRDLVRQISNRRTGSIAVVDERGEIFPMAEGMLSFDTGKQTDVLTGCSKSAGIDMALRAMGPAVIAVDEITAKEDCEALLQAGWCGVKVLATAHASNVSDLKSRPIYKKLWDSGIFPNIIVLNRFKTWTVERMAQ